MYHTGDVVLFYDAKSWISRAIDYLAGSDYSHCGMLVVDPPWIAERGVYIIQSGAEPIPNAEDDAKVFGVSTYLFANVLATYPGTVAVRHIRNAHVDRDLLTTVHAKVHELPYNLNLVDWIKAGYLAEFHGSSNGYKEVDTRFWCSALVAYMYVRLGWLPHDYPYMYATPSAFGRHANNLPLCTNIELGPIMTLK